MIDYPFLQCTYLLPALAAISKEEISAGYWWIVFWLPLNVTIHNLLLYRRCSHYARLSYQELTPLIDYCNSQLLHGLFLILGSQGLLYLRDLLPLETDLICLDLIFLALIKLDSVTLKHRLSQLRDDYLNQTEGYSVVVPCSFPGLRGPGWPLKTFYSVLLEFRLDVSEADLKSHRYLVERSLDGQLTVPYFPRARGDGLFIISASQIDSINYGEYQIRLPLWLVEVSAYGRRFSIVCPAGPAYDELVRLTTFQK